MPGIEPSEFAFILPEIVLIGTVLLTLVADLLAMRKSAARIPATGIAFVGIVCALAAVFTAWDAVPTAVLARSLLIDPISQFLKGVALVCGFGTIPVVASTKEIDPRDRGEVSMLILLVLLAVMVLASAQSLLVIFIGLQMGIMACGLLVAFRSKPRASSEAGLKYFLHAELVSLVFLFGAVLLFFRTDSTYLPEIREFLAAHGGERGFALVSFSFLLLGALVFGWVFPFQMLAPDVAQGSPVALSGFILVVPFIGSVALILRLCAQLFGKNSAQSWEVLHDVQWNVVFSLLSALTITIGTFGAVFQANIKRFLGYCMVGQIGYILLAMAALDYGALIALLSGLVNFCVAVLGVFTVAHNVVDLSGNEDLSAFRGLVWRDAFMGVLACVFVLSLSGLPPFGGFSSRFELMGAVIRGKLYWLSVVVIVNWVVGIVAYGKLLKEIFHPAREVSPATGHAPSARLAHGVLLAMLLPTVVLGVAWNPLHSILAKSIEKITW